MGSFIISRLELNWDFSDYAIYKEMVKNIFWI